MVQVVLRRLVASLGILVLVSAVVFVLVALIPGDPAVILAGAGATSERVAYFREALGLNDPVWVRYAHWLWNALHGDLGESLATSAPVTGLLWPPLTVTVTLVAVTLLFSSIIGLVLGMA